VQEAATCIHAAVPTDLDVHLCWATTAPTKPR
jgi:hypothetical protein